MSVSAKICGLGQPSDVDACVAAGARYVGLVFFAKSPRHLELSQAQALSVLVPPGIAKVALTVNADNAFLEQLVDQVPLDMLQLHGAETPDRVAEIRDHFKLPVMKAVGLAGPEDLRGLDDYMRVADQILVDAKPPKGKGALPGGNGFSFDWRLVAGRRWSVPWMLAGGLRPDNVAEAVRLTGAHQVDVSSGVEIAPGVKDAELIHDFVTAAIGEPHA